MNKLDDQNFHPKLAPPKARGQVRIPFISRVVKASAKAGNPIGRRLHSPSARPGAKLGRGQVAARLVGQQHERQGWVAAGEGLVQVSRLGPREVLGGPVRHSGQLEGRQAHPLVLQRPDAHGWQVAQPLLGPGVVLVVAGHEEDTVAGPEITYLFPAKTPTDMLPAPESSTICDPRLPLVEYPALLTVFPTA